jgi:hypothetical protein
MYEVFTIYSFENFPHISTLVRNMYSEGLVRLIPKALNVPKDESVKNTRVS